MTFAHQKSTESTKSPAGASAGAAPGRDTLRGMGFEAGSAAVSPGVQLKPASVQLKPASVQLHVAARQGHLTRAQEQSAVRYNNARGFSSHQIRHFQRILKTDDDGVFGPRTAEAVARFQARNGLEVDGKIGPMTERVLTQEIEPHNHGGGTGGGNGGGGGNEAPLRAGQLSANFTLAEFASRDGAPTPDWAVANLRELAQQLEELRKALGAPLRITSGYRSPAHNKAVGGASNSQHMYGRAADITAVGYSPHHVKQTIEKLIKQGRMRQGGVGLYASFVHYDIRGSAARWTG